MPKKSLDSVKAVFADKHRLLKELKEYARRIKKNSPAVEKIGYFGSYANDTYGPASDVDLFIVLKKSAKRFLNRLTDYIPEDLSVGCDVFPYTKLELKQMKQDGNPWLKHILKEIIWL